MLRICAHCERVFLRGPECPKCAFGSYDASWTLGGRIAALIELVFQTGWRKHIPFCPTCSPVLNEFKRMADKLRKKGGKR